MAEVSDRSAAFHQVWNMLQPPSATGARLSRCCSMVAQSMSRTSTVMPNCLSRFAVTWIKAVITGISTGLSSTTGVPS